jgi:hypothetical protein
MHEEPLDDAAKQREGHSVDNVTDDVKYPGINFVSIFAVFLVFHFLEIISSCITSWKSVAVAEFHSSVARPLSLSQCFKFKCRVFLLLTKQKY